MKQPAMGLRVMFNNKSKGKNKIRLKTNQDTGFSN